MSAARQSPGQSPGPAADAAAAAALFAVDPTGTGGVCLRSPPHPVRDAWLALLRQLLPDGTRFRRVPFNIPDGRLLGGLDLVATLKAGRPVAGRGILAESDGGVVILTMAERLTADTVARIGAAMDSGEIAVPREGVTVRSRARVGVVALDEGAADDEHAPPALLDRLAFWLDIGAFGPRQHLEPPYGAAEVEAARARLPQVRMSAAVLEALCATALGLGAGSARVSVLAARVACAAAALAGRLEPVEADAVLAGRLVLAPRASIAPKPPGEASPEEPQADPGPPPGATDAAAEPPEGGPPRGERLEDVVLAAAQASIPPGLLLRLRAQAGERTRRAGASGKSGEQRRGGARGRPAGVFAGPPQGRMRLNLVETLRAAAPWQALRGRVAHSDARLRMSPEDFRVTRHEQRTQTLTIFVVDASGSTALNRLAEAKGAVELLLADCYIRRDQVAVVAFRGRKAELLLPPTRSLVRAKRGLAGLPGGGGTPLASALEAAQALAMLARRRGETPTLVLLTDGRANVARDGAPGRETAHAQALGAARALKLERIAALFVDTSPRPNPLARELALGMNAVYLPLPFAESRSLAAAVKAVTSR